MKICQVTFACHLSCMVSSYLVLSLTLFSLPFFLCLSAFLALCRWLILALYFAFGLYKFVGRNKPNYSASFSECSHTLLLSLSLFASLCPCCKSKFPCFLVESVCVCVCFAGSFGVLPFGCPALNKLSSRNSCASLKVKNGSTGLRSTTAHLPFPSPPPGHPSLSYSFLRDFVIQ